jgi:hypothetical protein
VFRKVIKHVLQPIHDRERGDKGDYIAVKRVKREEWTHVESWSVEQVRADNRGQDDRRDSTSQVEALDYSMPRSSFEEDFGIVRTFALSATYPAACRKENDIYRKHRVHSI